MNTFDIFIEIEYAIRDIVLASKTRYVTLRAKKLAAARPALKKVVTPKVGWALNYILREYEKQGLIRILDAKHGHFMRFYIYVKKSYDDYIKHLDQQPQAPTPTTN